MATSQRGTDAPTGRVGGFDPALIHDAILAGPPVSPELDAGQRPSVAEPVWVSPGVAGYHVSSQCSALLFDALTDPDDAIQRVELADAEQRGLTICRWCAAWRQLLTA